MRIKKARLSGNNDEIGKEAELSATSNDPGKFTRRSILAGGLIASGGTLLAACSSPSTVSKVTAASPYPSTINGLYPVVGILTTASYWNGPKAALAFAEKHYGVKTSFSGTTGVNDADLVTIIEELIPRKPKGLMIEPADPADVQDVIGKAKAAGIPSIIVNAAFFPHGEQIGYVGFSRKEAAALGAEVIAHSVSASTGTVVAMVFSASAVAMVDALQGFKAAMAQLKPNLKILEVVDNADITYGTRIMTETLTSHPDVVAVMGLDTTGGQSAANAVTTLGRKDVTIVAGGLDESQTEYWPLIESGVVRAGILSSSFEQFWVSMQYLVNLNGDVIDGIDWRKYPSVRVVPENTDLGSFVLDKTNISAVDHLNL